MARLRLAIVNHWDEDVLAVTSASGTMPVDNTQKTARGLKWRSAGGSPIADQTFTWALSVTRAANMLAIFGHNLAGGTARLKLFSDTGATANVYDSTALTIPSANSSTAGANYGMDGTSAAASDDLFGNTQPFVLYFSATQFKAATLTLGTGAISTADGYIEAGRIWLAMYRESSVNPDYGMALSHQSNTTAARTRGGSLRTNNGETWRRLDLNIGSAPETDRPFWDDVQQYSQIAKDVFISCFPGDGGRAERDYQMNGRFVSLDPLIYDLPYRKQHLVIEEL